MAKLMAKPPMLDLPIGVSRVLRSRLVKLTQIYNPTAINADLLDKLPATGEISELNGIAIAGLSPRSWLVFGSNGDLQTHVDRIQAASPGAFLSNELTHSQTLLEIEIGVAQRVLNAYSAVDQAALFDQPSCTRTRFGDITITLMNRGSETPLLMMFDHCYAAYMSSLLNRPH